MGNKIKGLYLRGQVYWYTFQIAGRRQFISLNTSDKNEAIRKVLDIQSSPEKIESGLWEWEVKNYIKQETRREALSKDFGDTRQWALLKFGRLNKINSPGEVTLSLAQNWYDQTRRKQSLSTAQQNITSLRVFLNFLVKKKKLRENVALAVVTQKFMRSPRKDFVDSEIVAGLLEKARGDSELLFILHCGFDAGFRKNEIIEARPEWFDHSDGVVTISKTTTFKPKDRDERTIPLRKRFREFLKEYGRPSPFMLCPDVKHGKNRYRYDFRKRFKSFVDHCGYPDLKIHDMRRSFASNLVKARVSPYKVAVWIGDNINTFQESYGHLMGEDDDIESGVNSS